MSPPVFPDRQGDIYNGEEGGEKKDNEKKIDREELQKADFADGNARNRDLSIFFVVLEP